MAEIIAEIPIVASIADLSGHLTPLVAAIKEKTPATAKPITATSTEIINPMSV